MIKNVANTVVDIKQAGWIFPVVLVDGQIIEDLEFGQEPIASNDRFITRVTSLPGNECVENVPRTGHKAQCSGPTWRRLWKCPYTIRHLHRTVKIRPEYPTTTRSIVFPNRGWQSEVVLFQFAHQRLYRSA